MSSGLMKSLLSPDPRKFRGVGFPDIGPVRSQDQYLPFKKSRCVSKT